MNVVYTAPNRAHHYQYALAMYRAGMLFSFVSGFSRFSPRADIHEIGNKLRRVDLGQNIFLASLKFRMPPAVSDYLAYLAKVEQDFACKKLVKAADVFLFYNGSGLISCKEIQRNGGLAIVEAVNSHVDFQENILSQEYKELGLPWRPFHKAEKQRRIEEYERADYILVPSEFARRSFLEYGYAEETLLKVPYGFDLPALDDQHEEDNGQDAGKRFTVLYVGSLSVRKGIRYLVEAFQKLKHPNKRLLLVGPVFSPDGLNGISLTPDIEKLGVLKGKDLQEVYKRADVFCLPSIEEGFGLVLGEALSYGLPIIATENTGGPDLIEDTVDGFIVPPQDSNSILEKLELLSESDETRHRISLAALSKSRLLKGWADTGSLLVSTLEGVHAKNRGI